jgi:hypothetical protein
MSTTGTNLTQELAAKIMAASTITDLIGQRFWNIKAPVTDTAPYVVMNRISGVSMKMHDGVSGVEDVRFQLAIYGESVSNLDLVRDALNTELDGFRGAMGVINVGFIFFDNEIDGLDVKSEYRFKILDYRVRLNG